MLTPCQLAIGEQAADHEKAQADSPRTFFVDCRAANTSDDNPGTEGLPLKPIQAGAELARAGDTVLVKAGVHLR